MQANRLVISEEPGLRETMLSILKTKGHQVTGVENECSNVESVRKTYSSRKGKILVINDSPRNMSRLEKWLAKTDYRYAFAGSANEAAALMKYECFDSIIYGHEFCFPYYSRSL